jgi:peptide/nickel transport system substrate-binding protein
MTPGRPDEPAGGLIEGIPQRGETTAAPAGDSDLLTFLIADVRGYTRFTQERGDEAAAQLTATFAMIVRELVPGFGGTVVELRGDEALCVFGSPRQSLRAAIALQHRFVEHTAEDVTLPLTVGIGMDVGEAVRAEEGYRGGALNLAARLCAQAHAGEVLASPELAHLARTVEGIRYVELERVRLKGLREPVRPVRVLPAGDDPARQIAALLAAARPAKPRKAWPIAVGAAVGAAVVASGVLVVVLRPESAASTLRALDENSLGVIDPHSGKLLGEVAVGAGPTAVTDGFGSIWTANTDDNSVSRVDAKTRAVSHTIDVGVAPVAIAAGPNAVWVVNSGDATVSRIDPVTNRPTAIPVGDAPSGIVVARGSVWVTNSGNGTVSRIDPNQNAVAETIPVGDRPTGIAAGRDIWVANSAANTVSQIDGVSHKPTGTFHVGTAPQGVAVVGTSVWVTNSLGGTITRIPITGTSDPETVSVGQAQPAQVAAADGQVWVSVPTGERVVSIDPSPVRVVRTVRVGSMPGGIAAANGKLWVTTTIDPALHRGGTVHILDADPGSIDPTYPYSEQQLALLNSSYDGLVTFAHTTGADSTAIVPDLATAIPVPTNGGRTYTFQLRSGIRWSTGAPVTVSDVVRGLERAILAVAEVGTPLPIVGAGACTPARCAVSGIRADAANRTIAITLVRPTGALLDDLTFAYAVPAATPLGEQRTRVVPATGPYQVARYVPGKSVTLTRNPYFREWSAAAQPDGFPTSVEWRIDSNIDLNKPGVADVAAGRTDWADARFAAPFGTIQAEFGSRVHVMPTQNLHGLELNTRIPPFNDARVRRALAYAIDRRTIAANWGVPATITCQFLPPNYPGYRPYCPYTLSRDDTTGDWNGADQLRASRLVAQSHTGGMTVTLWSPPHYAKALGSVVSALNELGYHATLHVEGGVPYFDHVADSRSRVQAAFFGWQPGDASAASMLSLWRCSAYVPADPGNANPGGFCDPGFDRALDRADQIPASSPAEANAAFAALDRRLVDEVAWIPLVTPSWVDVVSSRVHNYKRNPVLGPLLDQIWLR